MTTPLQTGEASVFQRYPSILLLDRVPEIYAVKEVVATEKLHGSNFRLHFPLAMQSLDEVKFGSHETESTDSNFPLGRAVEWFKSRPDLLGNMWEVTKSYGFSEVTIFGEVFGPGIKAKGVRYSTGQEMLFRGFDIMVAANFVTYDLFVELADKMKLPRVPEVWRGAPSKEAFDALLERPSHVAKENGIDDESNLSEGIVIRSNPLLRNVFGEWLIAKHKSKKFSEVAHAPTEKKVREATPADYLATTYVTVGRIRNAIGRLTDRGVALKSDMTDMPTLLVEIVADLKKEAGADWDAAIAAGNEKSIQGSVSRVLGPLYRQFLSEG